jgi:hypothetical protein
MQRNLFLILAGIIFIAVLIYYFRPIFAVNGDIILRPEFATNLSAAEKAEKKFEEVNPSLPSGGDFALAAAQRILETHLVHAELIGIVDSKTLAPLLADKINVALGNPNFMSEAQDLYGLTPFQIKTYIVVPQAEEDILKSKFILTGKNFGDWLTDAKKSAKVKIYFAPFKWGGVSFVK